MTTPEQNQQIKDHARNLAECYALLYAINQIPASRSVPDSLLKILWEANNLLNGYAAWLQAREKPPAQEPLAQGEDT